MNGKNPSRGLRKSTGEKKRFRPHVGCVRCFQWLNHAAHKVVGNLKDRITLLMIKVPGLFNILLFFLYTCFFVCFFFQTQLWSLPRLVTALVKTWLMWPWCVNITQPLNSHTTYLCITLQNFAKANQLLKFSPNFEAEVLSRSWNWCQLQQLKQAVDGRVYAIVRHDWQSYLSHIFSLAL